jgi:hypothetical protein
MTDKITEEILPTFVSDVVGQQLAKGRDKGYSGFENASVASLAAQAMGKIITGNWQSALAYIAMAAAVWYNDKQDSQDQDTP